MNRILRRILMNMGHWQLVPTAERLQEEIRATERNIEWAKHQMAENNLECATLASWNASLRSWISAIDTDTFRLNYAGNIKKAKWQMTENDLDIADMTAWNVGLKDYLSAQEKDLDRLYLEAQPDGAN